MKQCNRLLMSQLHMLALFYIFLSIYSIDATARYSSYSDAAIDELRLELSDVKHELHSARIEIQLLEEKISKQERAAIAGKSQASKNLDSTQSSSRLNASAEKIDAFEKKILHLEKLVDKIVVDLRSVHTCANQAMLKTQELDLAVAAQDKKFDEVIKLKTTLSSISKAMGQPISQTPQTNASTYRVKAGDSLEKIARAHQMTVERLKQLNHLNHDKIVIGQELKLIENK